MSEAYKEHLLRQLRELDPDVARAKMIIESGIFTARKKRLIEQLVEECAMLTNNATSFDLGYIHRLACEIKELDEPVQIIERYQHLKDKLAALDREGL
jgi:histone acetyltransferase (RNA polymerase elongator complex component)